MLDIDKLRRDFELSLLFNRYDLPHYAGCMKKKDNGLYEDNHIEAAWRGYQTAADDFDGQAKRFEPGREITPGMITQFKELTGNKEVWDLDAKVLFGACMQVLADSPNY